MVHEIIRIVICPCPNKFFFFFLFHIFYYNIHEGIDLEEFGTKGHIICFV